MHSPFKTPALSVRQASTMRNINNIFQIYKYIFI